MSYTLQKVSSVYSSTIRWIEYDLNRYVQYINIKYKKSRIFIDLIPRSWNILKPSIHGDVRWS